MTTIHAYTNDQQLSDVCHSDVYRARSATMSMIPTKTGAALRYWLVVPELAGKLTVWRFAFHHLCHWLTDLLPTVKPLPKKLTSC